MTSDAVVRAGLAGWQTEPVTAGVVLLPEIPGPTPQVLALADHLVGSGFTVAAVSLFGEDGRALSPGYAARSFAAACISREFAAFARRADRPVAEYVRGVARWLHARVGGPGVGVIGMCFSGGFALASAVEPAVLAPVASQPSLPLPLGPGRGRDIGMSDRERDAVSDRVRGEGLCLLGLRFSEDAAVPRDRFRALRAAFGDGWLPIPIDSRPGNPHDIGRREHMILTSEDVDTPGHPTHAARAQVVDLLRERLIVPPAAGQRTAADPG